MKQIKPEMFFETAFDVGGYSICKLELGLVILATKVRSLTLSGSNLKVLLISHTRLHC